MICMRLITFCLILLPLSILSQNETEILRQLYDKQTLTFMYDGVMQDAEIKPIGTSIFKQDSFIAKLKTVPTAYASYKKANWKVIGAVGTEGVALSTLMIGLGTINVSNTPRLRNFTYTSIAIGTSFTALTYSLLHKGNTHYYHALWQYNKAAILRGYSDSLQREKISDLYDNKTILLTGTGFVQNGIYHKRGLYNQKMTSLFADNILATRHLKKSKRAAFLYKPFQKIGLLGAVYGLGQILTVEYHTKSQMKTGLYAMIIGGTFGLISIPLQAQADDHLAKAVWFYNRESLTGH